MTLDDVIILLYYNIIIFIFFFFFSSRRRHTRCLSDWSSDVCSSDLRTCGFRRKRSRPRRGSPASRRRSGAVLSPRPRDRRRARRRRRTRQHRPAECDACPKISRIVLGINPVSCGSVFVARGNATRHCVRLVIAPAGGFMRRIVFAALVIAACTNDATQPTTLGLSFSVVSGDGQSGIVGQPLANPLVIKATDSRGRPQKNLQVSFTVTSGGGSTNPASAPTDQNGFAQTS